MASEGPLTSEAYIEHHLTNLTYGQKPDGSWGIAQSQEEISQMGFWAINLDTMFWSSCSAVCSCFSLPSLQEEQRLSPWSSSKSL